MTIKQPLYYIACAVTFIILVYLMYSFGIFKIYVHLFSDKHLHRQNFIFRLSFWIVFSLVNHYYFVPRFYAQKHYTSFFSIVMLCLIAMLILPEFVITQPKFEAPFFVDGHPHLPPINSPIPAPLFEMVNMILLFSISTFSSMALRTRQNVQPSEPLNAEIEPAFEEKEEHNETERPTETALTVTVNYSLVRIDCADILYIKSMDNYLHFYLKDKKPILVRMTLKEAESKLPNTAFMRVHKSYIVAIAAIESIRNKTILIAKQELPIGRVYEEVVYKVFEK